MAKKNSTDHPSALRDRAEECRAIADILTEPALGAEYLKMAEAYLALAAQEERLSNRSRREA